MREVALLHQGDGQATARGVERDAAAGDAAADDEDVDLGRRELVQLAGAALPGQVRAGHCVPGCPAGWLGGRRSVEEVAELGAHLLPDDPGREDEGLRRELQAGRRQAWLDGADAAVAVPLLDLRGDEVDGRLLRGAEPVRDEREQQLGVHVEDAAVQRVVRQLLDEPPAGLDEALARGRQLLGLRADPLDQLEQLAGQQRVDDGRQVAVLPVDGHPAHPGAAGDVGKGRPTEADVHDAVTGGREERVYVTL